MQKMNLGIKKDLVAKAGIPINPPLPIEKPTQFFKSHSFPIAVLEKVEFVAEQETTDKQTQEVTKQPVIKFTFRDTVNAEKKITDTYYPLDQDDDKWDMKLDGLQKSIKHIFEETIGEANFDEADFAGSTFAELFENAANAFNKFETTKPAKKGEEEAEPVKIKTYSTVPLYLKLTYYNSRLSTPMYPNFVQKANKTQGNTTIQVPCELAISKKDVIVNKADAKPASANGQSARDNNFGGAFGLEGGAGIPDMVFPE